MVDVDIGNFAQKFFLIPFPALHIVFQKNTLVKKKYIIRKNRDKNILKKFVLMLERKKEGVGLHVDMLCS